MKYYPFIVVGAIIGVLTVVFILAYAFMKNKKEAIGFDRHMKDSEIIRRMGKYLKPYVWDFVLVIFIMLISIVYDVVSPLIVKNIEETIKLDF
jgi:ATP-binding cassette subfamily B protein